MTTKKDSWKTIHARLRVSILFVFCLPPVTLILHDFNQNITLHLSVVNGVLFSLHFFIGFDTSKGGYQTNIFDIRLYFVGSVILFTSFLKNLVNQLKSSVVRTFLS